MFNELTERLSKVINMIGKKARLTEENISASTREVRKALLEADVALPVVKEFTLSIFPNSRDLRLFTYGIKYTGVLFFFSGSSKIISPKYPILTGN